MLNEKIANVISEKMENRVPYFFIQQLEILNAPNSK